MLSEPGSGHKYKKHICLKVYIYFNLHQPTKDCPAEQPFEQFKQIESLRHIF